MFTNNDEVAIFFEQRRTLGIKPGLERMNQLLQLLDNPQDKIKAIHVAGTNGKGSTIGFLKKALMYNGYNVGVFSSPGLDGLTSHIFCGDEKISDHEFLALLNIIYPAIQKLDASQNHPTEFEIITVLAFMCFENHVDIAIIETGMGGREDTTNCFQPILSIITNIDKDHTDFLGKTIKEITYHKAGIIKKNISVVVGEVTDEAFSVIGKEAINQTASIYRLFDDFTYTSIMPTDGKQTFIWSEDKETSMNVQIHMLGVHQIKNSSLAMMALSLLKKQGFSINWKESIKGIMEATIPGRFEVIQTNPAIILDGAHNPAAIESFLEAVVCNYNQMDNHLIFAGFLDKDLQQMLSKLAPHFSTVTLTSFEHIRAARTKYLFQLTNHEEKYAIDDWNQIVHLIGENQKGSQNNYFFTGSLYFIAEIRRFFEKKRET